MVIDVKPLQQENASFAIEVTELGITVFLHPHISVLVADSTIALQLFLESYTVFPLSTLMVVMPLQPENALFPIEVTELGMVIDVKPSQAWNARSPIEVTELGMVIDVKPSQLQNAELPIEATELPNVTDVKPLQWKNA